jgi:hypothetical protein
LLGQAHSTAGIGSTAFEIETGQHELLWRYQSVLKAFQQLTQTGLQRREMFVGLLLLASLNPL